MLKSNDRHKFTQYLAMKSVREEGKPQCKLSYKIFKDQYVYYPLLDIFPSPTIIRMKDFIGRIHNCIVLKFLVSGVLTVNSLLHFLSLEAIYSTVTIIKMGKSKLELEMI